MKFACVVIVIFFFNIIKEFIINVKDIKYYKFFISIYKFDKYAKRFNKLNQILNL